MKSFNQLKTTKLLRCTDSSINPLSADKSSIKDINRRRGENRQLDLSKQQIRDKKTIKKYQKEGINEKVEKVKNRVSNESMKKKKATNKNQTEEYHKTKRIKNK